MVILKNSTRESAKIGQAIDTQFQTGGDPWLAVDIGTTTVVVDLYTSYGEQKTMHREPMAVML